MRLFVSHARDDFVSCASYFHKKIELERARMTVYYAQLCNTVRILEQSSGGPRSAPHDGLSHCGIFFVVLRNLGPIHHGPPFLDV